ncbi:KLTH0D12540p [Lachancea thermotolerans CBS 6340]|uniref:KLTH0D12540p n=1 Tax=Lachancea thermotolerans (strain ATCC 56472 / CBS 6340 / NRRL Y-8284) TaxID=559295 RepID=C5DF63_LACTC|nr:KLTH0D12540p [Lachancea thermotolerans CBS 6340]CAR22818.1 KLTH0D12540p [Lachancea thermotolerans CBS 6340]
MAFKTTLHVSGFPRGVRTRDLAPDFESIGRVVRIDMPPARSPYARPYAFVEYETPEEAQAAIAQLDQQPFSLDPQFSLFVQLARSEPRPSRFSADRGHPREPEPYQEYPPSSDYGARSYTNEHEYGEEYPPRRPMRDDMSRQRGAYGPRSYRSNRQPDYGSRRRELSPARVHTDGGPAPYQDVLHNNAASLLKKTETSSAQSGPQDTHKPNDAQDQDMDQYNPEDTSAPSASTLTKARSASNDDPTVPQEAHNVPVENSEGQDTSAAQPAAPPVEDSANKTVSVPENNSITENNTESENNAILESNAAPETVITEKAPEIHAPSSTAERDGD